MSQVRIALLLCLAVVGGRAAASIDATGLAGATPRSVALAGADAAVAGGTSLAAGSPLSAGSVADLARLDGPAILGGGGVATRGGGSALVLTGGGVVEGIGVAGTAIQRVRGNARERVFGVAGGMPTGAVTGLSMGLGLKALTASLGSDTAAGFAMDCGVAGRFGLHWQGVEVGAAVAIEDALGVLGWDSGLKEDLASRARLGLGAFRGPLALLTGLDLVRGPAGRAAIWSAGVEHGFEIRGVPGGLPVAVRAGWRDRPGTVCAGFGTMRGPASLDYAVAVGHRGVLHSLALEWRFPGAGRGGGVVAAGRGPKALARGATRRAEVVPDRDVFALDSPYRTIALLLRVPADERARGWTVLIAAPDGTVVWEASGEGEPPATVTWNGASNAGEPVATGTYVCRLLLRGATAPDYLSPGSLIRLVRPASTKPMKPGETGEFDVPASVRLPRVPEALPVAVIAVPAPGPVAVAVPAPADAETPRTAAARPRPATGPAMQAGKIAVTSLTVASGALPADGGKRIRFGVTRSGRVTAIVHDRNRRTVVAFPERDAIPPGGEIRWDGRRADGSVVPAGSYRVTVIATDGTSVDSRTTDLTVEASR